MSMQLDFLYDFGVTREQACIMCHLSSGCGGCCEKCRKERGYCNRWEESKGCQAEYAFARAIVIDILFQPI